MRRVTIETRSVGENFGCCGVIRDARSRRKLAETRVYPNGFDHAAAVGAVSICDRQGWRVHRAEVA